MSQTKKKWINFTLFQRISENNAECIKELNSTETSTWPTGRHVHMSHSFKKCIKINCFKMLTQNCLSNQNALLSKDSLYFQKTKDSLYFPGIKTLIDGCYCSEFFICIHWILFNQHFSKHSLWLCWFYSATDKRFCLCIWFKLIRMWKQIGSVMCTVHAHCTAQEMWCWNEWRKGMQLFCAFFSQTKFVYGIGFLFNASSHQHQHAKQTAVLFQLKWLRLCTALCICIELCISCSATSHSNHAPIQIHTSFLSLNIWYIRTVIYSF